MTGSPGMGPEELRSRLLGFDRAVALNYPGQSFRLILVGGGAMMLLGYLSRATVDLDVLAAPAVLQSLMAEYDLDGRVAAYQDHFAYNLEDRLVLLALPTSAVECWAASLEDLVASKLHSERDTDRADVRRSEVLAALDWGRLAEVAEDMHASSLNERRYRRFVDNYEEYSEAYGPCGG